MLNLLRWTKTQASPSRREILVEDAIAWLVTTPDEGAIVTRLPPELLDADVLTRILVVGRPAVLYVEDLAGPAGLISGPEHVCHMARHMVGVPLVWHAIARREVGFAHILGFGEGIKAAAGEVLEDGRQVAPGEPGLGAARAMVEWAAGHAQLILDPFAGAGTICAVAEALEVRAIGVVATEAAAQQARELKMLPAKRKRPRVGARGRLSGW